MESADLENFYGVPVVVQLKFPIAAVIVQGKGKIPYATDAQKSHLMPEPLMENGSPSGTQLVAFAVLRPIAGTVLEMQWASCPVQPPEGSGAIMGPVATLATMIDAKDIAAVTRVVSVAEPSLILKP